MRDKSPSSPMMMDYKDYIVHWVEISDGTKNNVAIWYLQLLKIAEEIKSDDPTMLTRLKSYKGTSMFTKMNSNAQWERVCINLGSILTITLFLNFTVNQKAQLQDFNEQYIEASILQEIKSQIGKLRRDYKEKELLHMFSSDIIELSFEIFNNRENLYHPHTIASLVHHICFIYDSPRVSFQEESVQPQKQSPASSKGRDYVQQILQNAKASGNSKVYPFKDIFQHYSLKYQDYQIFKDSKAVFPFRIYETGEFCHVQLFLLEILHKQPHRFVELIYSEILKSIRLTKTYYMVCSPNSGKALLAILQFMKILIWGYPLPQEGLIRQFIVELRPYLNWPIPVGDDVRDLIGMLVTELQFKGVTKLNYLRATIPKLDYFNPLTEGQDSETQQDSERLEAVFYSNTNIIVENLLVQHRRIYSKNQDQIRKSADIRRYLLYSFLKNNKMNFTNAQVAPILNKIKEFSDPEVFTYYKKLMETVNAINSSPNNVLMIKELRQTIASIYSEIQREALQYQKEKMKNKNRKKQYGKNKDEMEESNMKAGLEDKMQQKHQQNSQQGQGSSKSSRIDDPNQVYSSFINLRHWLVCINDYSRSEFCVLLSGVDEDLVSCDLDKYIRRKLEWFQQEEQFSVLKMQQEKINNIMKVMNPDAILNHRNQIQRYLQYTNPFKFVIYGGTGTLHEFLQYYMTSIRNFPQFSQSNFCRFYILPDRNSAAGYYISRRDHWYQRYIFAPFAVNPLNPLINPKEFNTLSRNIKQNFNSSLEDQLKAAVKIPRALPFELLEKNLQMYLNHATKFIKIYLYEVIAYGKFLFIY